LFERRKYLNAVQEIRVGVLSDTHGLLRAQTRAFLVGCDYIIHAGDIGAQSILDDLGALAPLIAVRGNNDTEPWAAHLPETELVRVGGTFVCVIHDLARLDVDLHAACVGVVVAGHSHKPMLETRAGVLYFNPGSCGPRRFKLPISMGELTVRGENVSSRVIELDNSR
jgi:uncharacterized protein